MSIKFLFKMLYLWLTNADFSIHYADEFFLQLVDSRICWIRGLLGGGKTSLAFMLAAFLLKLYPSAFKCVASNIPHHFPVPVYSEGVTNSVVVFDEMGIFLDSRTWAKNSTIFYQALRKLNTVVIAPSKNPPDKRLTELWVERYLAFGQLCWWYNWRFELGTKFVEGIFFVWRPTRVFGLYSTGAYPTGDQGLLDLFQKSLSDVSSEAQLWVAYADDREAVSDEF